MRPSRSRISRSFRARCRAVSKIAAPFLFDNAAFNNVVSGLYQLPLGRIMGADNVHAIKGERMYDTGSTTFMLICTMLVFLMTPGLAFFYGGLDQLLCLPVLGQVLQAAAKMPKKNFVLFEEVTTGLAKRYLEELNADVTHFCRMFDYRNAGGDWGNSKDAIERAIRYLTSREPENRQKADEKNRAF